jgi:small subunit ribosomal protein S4
MGRAGQNRAAFKLLSTNFFFMIIGPKYKICKRLGAPIFEQCQTRSFVISKERTAPKRRGGRASSDYSRQLIEKQKLRLTYGLTERQFGNYVTKALESKVPQATLFALLESRLDSMVYRTGLAPTRRAARQLVSHGHITVNGKRVTVPSYQVAIGDQMAVREGSRDIGPFSGIEERLGQASVPSWISFDASARTGTLGALPSTSEREAPADIGVVFEYYTR